jgi:hypothetical protein
MLEINIGLDGMISVEIRNISLLHYLGGTVLSLHEDLRSFFLVAPAAPCATLTVD